MKTLLEYPKIDDDIASFFDDEHDDIVLQEKIDGANFRFAMLSDGLCFGSRERILFGNVGRFQPCMDYVADHVAKSPIPCSLIYFGECCVPHRLQYRWDEIPPFVGYDVYSPFLGEFLADPEPLFDALGLPFAPIVRRCKAGDVRSITEDLIPQSVYADVKAEGVVFKNYVKQEFFKYVRADFAEKGKGGKHKDYSIKLHTTRARVEKILYKLIDDGQGAEGMMAALVPKIAEDIRIESGSQLHQKDIEKRVSGLCHRVCRDLGYAEPDRA